MLHFFQNPFSFLCCLLFCNCHQQIDPLSKLNNLGFSSSYQQPLNSFQTHFRDPYKISFHQIFFSTNIQRYYSQELSTNPSVIFCFSFFFFSPLQSAQPIQPHHSIEHNVCQLHALLLSRNTGEEGDSSTSSSTEIRTSRKQVSYVLPLRMRLNLKLWGISPQGEAIEVFHQSIRNLHSSPRDTVFLPWQYHYLPCLNPG